MIEEGNYSGIVKSGITSASRAKGTPQIVLTVDVSHYWDGTDWAMLEGTNERRIYLALTDAAWEFTRQRLEAVGFNGDFDNPSFSDEPVRLKCSHETYNGKVQERWDIDTGGGTIEKAGADVVRTLNAKWKAKAAPVGAPKPTGKPAAPKSGSVAGFPKGPPSPAMSAALSGDADPAEDDGWKRI